MKKVWYIATPYTGYAGTLDEAYTMAKNYANGLRKQGFKCISPIEEFHTMAAVADMPKGANFWMPVNDKIAETCYGCIVVCLPGWLKSEGIAHEISTFASARKPILFTTYLAAQPAGIDYYDKPMAVA
jgi:hypothetical protein